MQLNTVCVDPANPLLKEVQAQLDTGVLETPQGKKGIITIRTTSATVTVMLDSPDIANWGEVLIGLSQQVGSKLVTATMTPENHDRPLLPG